MVVTMPGHVSRPKTLRCSTERLSVRTSTMRAVLVPYLLNEVAMEWPDFPDLQQASIAFGRHGRQTECMPRTAATRLANTVAISCQIGLMQEVLRSKERAAPTPFVLRCIAW
ncbi:hypothetical protein SAMN02927914_03105 [Mesorhizobium qingshengii]|uniref:Uncharacterized protein n=1 Tax=Mesorhizobium qingshengii TaxID=1165689 RepID=A0A1G5YA68_9HYPH|nr:hypothetical protein SAMN02927914_03105 [Mesorhizobium qingshengii]